MTTFDVMGFLSTNSNDPVLNSQENKLHSIQAAVKGRGWPSTRRVYQKWTKEETDHLLLGCKRHGVGNWKAILSDPELRFNGRSTVDLKDRFRISVPEDYRRLYPGTKGKPTRLKDFQVEGNTRKVKRRDRVPFAPIEDESIFKGYQTHGPRWAKILEDPKLTFDMKRVRSDLRDRFRILDPDAYADRQVMFDKTAPSHEEAPQSRRSKVRERKKKREQMACKISQQLEGDEGRRKKAGGSPQRSEPSSYSLYSANIPEVDLEMKPAMSSGGESMSASPRVTYENGLSCTELSIDAPLLSPLVEDVADDAQAQIQKLIWDPIYQHRDDS